MSEPTATASASTAAPAVAVAGEEPATAEPVHTEPATAAPADVEPAVEVGAAPAADAPDVPWLRLDKRVVWVNALQLLLSQLPAIVALFVVGANPGTVWPLAIIAGWGVVRSTADLVRWLRTRYRITEAYVERRTGLFVREFRSVRRDRIRSVDADAKLLQRAARLRRVTIGAGQANTAGESALTLNAVSLTEARALRHQLLGAAEGADGESESPAGTVRLAGFRWWWVCYNMFSVWAYLTAAGLLWGAYWMTMMFGLDLGGWITGLADWDALGLPLTVLLALAGTGTLGVLGMAVAFFTEHANFRLERVPTPDGTVLRTSQGLFKTREVTRDDKRLRGVTLSEPLLWRWMRTTDTNVVTTGLSVWSSAATILPRGPMGTARRVADAVLAEPDSPLGAPLRRHPATALRRRAGWALMVSGAVCGLLAWLGATTAVPDRAWWLTALVLLPLTLTLAAVGHRALGHTIAGRHLLVRSGALSRTTTALRRDAVSGVRVRQSLLQRRLGLATVSVSTAAGHGVYEAPDLAAGEAAGFAAECLPVHVEPFRTDRPAPS
ncbi:PH domain-containing protein [Streptomyces sp. XM4193]|uniref:PH domain-containing protein n=1 Tax=Streptomyces sp. XM4193 TaxID=2929782 RepID=UPI001FFA7BE7|nr:PH domain-containing protein [Streptomyces sp. XM4193]MCK1796610.1 PH domain-containing protein [Streptomyces sp. XM4193]